MRTILCWNSCDTTDWKRSTTRGLGGGGPWLHVITGCLLREDTSVLISDEGVHSMLLFSPEADTVSWRRLQDLLATAALNPLHCRDAAMLKLMLKVQIMPSCFLCSSSEAS
jgi:hypothetical protein